MKDLLIRIAASAGAGFFVSLGWGLYFASANKGVPVGSIVSFLARLTQPAAAIILYVDRNFPLGLTWVVAANTATYALFGLVAGMLRQAHRAPGHFAN